MVSDEVEPDDFEPVDLEPLDFEPLDFEPLDFEPEDLEPLDFEPLDFEPEDFEPEDLEPLLFEPLDFEPVDFEPLDLPVSVDFWSVGLDCVPCATTDVDMADAPTNAISVNAAINAFMKSSWGWIWSLGWRWLARLWTGDPTARARISVWRAHPNMRCRKCETNSSDFRASRAFFATAVAAVRWLAFDGFFN